MHTNSEVFTKLLATILRRRSPLSLLTAVLVTGLFGLAIPEHTHARAIAMGKYTAGCLFHGKELAINGKGWQAMRLSRKRYFGHPIMIDYIKELAGKVKDRGYPDLLIGDISRQKGGPFRRGHRSHQIGLDADVWFLQPKKNQKLSKRDRERLSATQFVTSRNKNLKLKKTWTRRHSEILRIAADDDRVSRIFVNAAIKKHLCSEYPQANWLHKIRPWWSHRDHFHVRLHCPKGSTNCIPQPAVADETNGCDETLAWWFSDEADKEWRKMLADKSPYVEPELPEQCVAYLGK